MTKPNKRGTGVRVIVLALILAAVLLVYTIRLIDMQMIHRGKWVQDLNPENTRTAVLPAARGEILDRYGRPLSVNREGYNLILDGANLKKDKLNSTLKTLVELLKTTGEPWRDILPLSDKAPYGFAESEDGSDAKSASMKRRLQLNTYATAGNCYDAMVSRYQLQNYTKEYQRILMGIRYTMEAEDFSVASRYVFAEDISLKTTLKLKENPSMPAGVDVDVAPIREYAAPDVAPHLLGTVGPIREEDWTKNKETYLAKGYRMSDNIGNSGMEKAAEEHLRGTDGKKLIRQDSRGNVTSTEVVQEPVAGNTLILTLDSRLQKAAQNALEKRIKAMKQSGHAAAAKSVGAGAAVVIDVNTGEILAAANYPSYNLNDYKTNAAALLNDNKNRPLFDRAFNGGYPVGSTFKPATALVGLQTGEIDGTTPIRCTGVYRYYPDTPFGCLGTHGNISLISALAKSCNIYFYETARRVGITRLNQYCRLFGLGVATGVEVPEWTGILAGPEYRATRKLVWNPGDTLQAAIGQSDNSLTMLQMAVYASTIANNGTRYAAHLTKEIKTYSLDETVEAYQPKVLNTTGIAESHYTLVKKGMLSVTEAGTGRAVFSNYPIKVGGKTGTAQNTSGLDHSVFIAFAPYENPEIAVSILLEQVVPGYTATQVARDILDAYFFPEIESYAPQTPGTLLS